LLPRKSKEFIKPTAEKLGCSEQLVDDVRSFYWQQVRNSLSNPNSIGVMIADFGSFNIKPWKLNQFIIKYERIVQNTDLNTFQKFAAVKQLEKKKLIIDKLIEQVAELKLKKQSVKEKRYEKTNKDLENPETNLGGN